MVMARLSRELESLLRRLRFFEQPLVVVWRNAVQLQADDRRHFVRMIGFHDASQLVKQCRPRFHLKELLVSRLQVALPHVTANNAKK